MRASISWGLAARWLPERGYGLKKGCQGQDPAFRGLQGTFNAVGEFGIWKNHRPLTVPWGPYRQRYISWSKGAGWTSCVTRDHQNLSRCLSAKDGAVKFLKAPLYFYCLFVPCFLLYFWQTHVSFQQDEESSMIILNIIKCILEICHSGKRQDVTRRDLLKTCILVSSKIQLSILRPFLPHTLKTFN